MALHLGELVAGLRADDSQFQRSLGRASLAMRGLTRDINGQLRDTRGRFVSASEGMGRSLSQSLGNAARSAAPALRGVAVAGAGIGVGLPAAAAMAVAVGGIAAAAASAGAAVMAFKLAAQPQLEQVTQVADLAAEAQKALAEGADDAAEKQKAFADAMSRLPPATRATATAFVGLKSDYKKWSDSLSSTTMPVFTKGIGILRSLLPSLTPLVKAAAAAFSDFLDGVAARQGSIAGFLQELAGSAKQNLGAFLRSIANVGKGAAGIIRAFLPLSGDMSGGIESATAAFARWGQGLKDSAGFAKFVELARQGGQMLGQFALAAGNLLVALSPILGVTTQLALAFAQVINALPPGVLTVLATQFLMLAVGVKAITLAMTLWSTATRIAAAVQWLMNTALFASPITWIVLAIVALIAVIVLIATKTDWFQKIWKFVWNAVKTFFAQSVNNIKAAASWLAQLPGLLAGWFGKAKDFAIRAFTQLVSWVTGFPGRVVRALSSLASMLVGVARRALEMHNSAVRTGITAAVNLVRGLPGRAVSALGNLGNRLMSAGKSLVQGFIDGITSKFSAVKNKLGDLTSKLTDWKGPAELDARILTPAGQSVIEGFQRGIAAQVPSLRGQLQGITAGLPSDLAINGARTGSRTTHNNVTYNLTQRDMTLRDLEALQRRQDALARVGRPR